MKSDIYTEKQKIETILTEMDRIGQFCKLSTVSASRLRLVAEEMLSLTARLFDDLKYEFYVESDENRFTLCLTAETVVNQSKKEKMLSLSTSGKNKATQGFFGKISGIFESLLTDSGEFERIYIPYYDRMVYENIGLMPYFSLTTYRDELNAASLASTKTDKEEWDGLEKSIIETLAKEVIIGARNKKAEMIVIMEF
ncbi:MAG: hypothetical protein FWH17_00340 [Oscillospiraceae bacterium]|nr:hypothetical protein [Oscillospiraceae bacterium]